MTFEAAAMTNHAPMSAERRPMSTRAKVVIMLAALCAVGLVGTSAFVALSAHESRRRIRVTRELLDEKAQRARTFISRAGFPDSTRWCTRTGGSVEYEESRVLMHVSGGRPKPPADGWGRTLRLQCPGPVHRVGWDIWSVGPNGVDEHGKGDDILVGEDVVPVGSGAR